MLHVQCAAGHATSLVNVEFVDTKLSLGNSEIQSLPLYFWAEYTS